LKLLFATTSPATPEQNKNTRVSRRDDTTAWQVLCFFLTCLRKKVAKAFQDLAKQRELKMFLNAFFDSRFNGYDEETGLLRRCTPRNDG
jgi:hypothetical protein